MATLNVQISGLSEETLRKLDEKVARDGCARDDYLRDLIERDVYREDSRSVNEALELFVPVQQEFALSGLTDGELDELIAQARDRVGR